LEKLIKVLEIFKQRQRTDSWLSHAIALINLECVRILRQRDCRSQQKTMQPDKDVLSITVNALCELSRVDEDVSMIVMSCRTSELNEKLRAIHVINPELLLVLVIPSDAGEQAAQPVETGGDEVLVSKLTASVVKSTRLRHGSMVSAHEVARAGTIVVDRAAGFVFVEGRQVLLTKTEREILFRLVQKGVLAHDEILREILLTTDRFETSKVRYHIANLRRKLGVHGALIETVRPRSVRLNLKAFHIRGIELPVHEDSENEALTAACTQDSSCRPSR
jgi:hypothetical protein